MNRSPSRSAVLTEKDAPVHFLGLLADLDRCYSVEIHAYCVMGNHYHLLLRAPDAVLSRAIDDLEERLERGPAHRRGADGPTFRERFRAFGVRMGRHLVLVSRYVHLNPVAAGLTCRAEDWPWSSMRGYLNPAFAPPWLRTSAVLGWFCGAGARQRYRQLVRQGLDRGTRDAFGRARWAPVLGDADLVERVRAESELLDDASRRALPASIITVPRLPMSVVARAVGAAFGVDPRALRLLPGATGRAEALARGAFVHLARRLGGWTLAEVAGWLGYSSTVGAAAAAGRFRRATVDDPGLARRLEGVKAALLRSRSWG